MNSSTPKVRMKPLQRIYKTFDSMNNTFQCVCFFTVVPKLTYIPNAGDILTECWDGT